MKLQSYGSTHCGSPGIVCRDIYWESCAETSIEGWLEDGRNRDVGSDRDMNIVINWGWMEDLFNLIISLNGSVTAYEALPADQVIQYMP